MEGETEENLHVCSTQDCKKWKYTLTNVWFYFALFTIVCTQVSRTLNLYEKYFDWKLVLKQISKMTRISLKSIVFPF